MKKKMGLAIFIVCICISVGGCEKKQDKAEDSISNTIKSTQKEENTSKERKLKDILEKGKKDAETIDYQGYLAAMETLKELETPDTLFSSEKEMEMLVYNMSLLENTNYEIVEQELVAKGISKESSKKRYELIKKYAKETYELVKDVYLGKSKYSDEDEKFMNRYSKFFDEMQEGLVELHADNQGYYGDSEETLQLGETEMGTYVVSTYQKLDSLDTGMRWKEVEDIPWDDIQLPPLTNSEMVYGDYFQKFRTIASYGEGDVTDSGFTFLPELELYYNIDENSRIAQGSPEMVLTLETFNNQVDIQEWRMYFNSDEELANYYLDAMVKCMQVLYSDFGITEEMRMNFSGLITESLSDHSSQAFCYVEKNNRHMIIAHGDKIIFR